MISRRLIAWWDKFWFSRQSPACVCLLRISSGMLALACALRWAPNLFVFFGQHAIVSTAAIQAYEKSPRFSLLFWLPQTDASVIVVFTLLLVTAVFVIAGYRTRLSCLVLFMSLLSFQHRNVAVMSAADQILSTLVLLLAVSPSGDMFSIDHVIAQRRQPSTARQRPVLQLPYSWSTRLIQLQVAAVYFQVFWAKMADEFWQNGTAVYYSTRMNSFVGLPIPYIFDHAWSYQLVTWGTLSIEFALWALIWVKAIRYFVLLFGCILHLGILWTMNLPIFELLMISSYVVFVDPVDLKRFGDRVASMAFSLKERHSVRNRSGGQQPYQW